MSLENVRAFYERLVADESFRTQIQGVDSKEAGREILQNAGYNFTQKELEEYTEKLLATNANNENMRDLTEQEIEAVFGGISSLIYPGIPPIMLYGVVISAIRIFL
ncbi:MAG: Nif11-like leader peptide family natural product precursor [Goleter apudmare HA4340-LM2]|jgi:predicted ribosomally synthesized peptide with nif11-like leader|nr:Nif11-like leader peptide family natural product precursor [Goleter apudmare HA4340-LM2]